MRKICLIVLLVCLIALLAGCQTGLTNTERANYLKLADTYEKLSFETQKQANDYWDESQKIPPSVEYNQKILEHWRELATAKDRLAQNYRDEAYRYRSLVTRN